MRKLVMISLPALAGLLVLAGCGGGSSNLQQAPNGVPVSMTIRDTPANVTVLSFEIHITGATLLPGNLPLLTTDREIEITQLETDPAFLSTAGVPPGTYTGVTITFANPELTILNNTGGAIAGCAAGAICELQPQFSPVSVTLSFPNSLTLTQGMALALKVDLNLAGAVQNDLSVSLTPATVTVAAVPSANEEDEVEDLHEITGQVQTVGSNQFVLTTSFGQSFTINVDGNTQFDFSESGCAANNFTCVAQGQILEVELVMMGNGSFLATQVSLEENANREELEGIVIQIGAGTPPTSFEIVVHDEEPDVPDVAVGNPVTVQIQNGAAFLVNSGDLTLPSGVSFAGAADLLVGQEVDLRVVGTPSAGPPITVTTDQVTLTDSQITATVNQVTSPTLILSNLPSLLTGAGINQVQVDTTSQTEFENFTDLATLTGKTVSVGGLLFRSAGDPILAAEKVVLR